MGESGEVSQVEAVEPVVQAPVATEDFKRAGREWFFEFPEMTLRPGEKTSHTIQFQWAVRVVRLGLAKGLKVETFSIGPSTHGREKGALPSAKDPRRYFTPEEIQKSEFGRIRMRQADSITVSVVNATEDDLVARGGLKIVNDPPPESVVEWGDETAAP